MTIAINANNFLKVAGGDFFYEYFLNTAGSMPEHYFIFITAPNQHNRPAVLNNIIHVNAAPRSNNALMWKIWLDYTLPAIAGKHHADIIINTCGACSLRTKIPQWLFISDLSFLTFPHAIYKKEHAFSKRNMAAWLIKAAAVVTCSDFLSKQILLSYSTIEQKIHLTRLPVPGIFKPAGYNEKESVKEKYAEGKEYFFFSGEIQARPNLENLLKAFSFFKKRQKSNMQLVITGKATLQNEPFIESLQTYKFRKEVKLLWDITEKELAAITSAAYAMLYPVAYDGIGAVALEAMQSGVPVIATATGALNEFGEGTILYADPANFEDLANKMMLLFTDETYRAQLISVASLSLEKNRTLNTEGTTWKSILNN